MLVYLFRDQDRSATLAYSTDVTGRNLPRAEDRRPTGRSWRVASHEETREGGEAARHLRRDGFYILDKLRNRRSRFLC